MSLPATETFTDTDEVSLTAHSASWTNNYGAFAIFSNSLRSNGGDGTTDACAHWNADTFADNQYAQAVVAATSSDYIGLAARVAVSVATFYDYIWNTGDQGYLAKYVNGTGTNLGTHSSAAYTVGKTLKLGVEGTSLTVYLDGASDLGPVTDASISSGYAGVSGTGSGTAGDRIDNWEGGNISPPPSPPVRADYSNFPKPLFQGAL